MTPLLDDVFHVKLTMRSLAGWTAPGSIRLRSALNALLRSYGLRCERVESLEGDCKPLAAEKADWFPDRKHYPPQTGAGSNEKDITS